MVNHQMLLHLSEEMLCTVTICSIGHVLRKQNLKQERMLYGQESIPRNYVDWTALLGEKGKMYKLGTIPHCVE